MAEYSGRDKRLQYLFEHIGDGGTANLYGTTAPDSSITADDGTLYIQYDDTSYEVVALFAMIEQSWQEINVGGGGGGGNTLVIQDASIYSTEEQQVGVWIDEKPLYQKTISVTASGNWPSVFTTLENLPNLETCVRIELTIHRASGAYYTANGSSSAEYVSVPSYTTYKVAGGVFGVGTNPHLEYYVNGYTSSDVDKIWFTLWYTKTTDAAGSGGYKAYGLSPIIYSTEEREVGVWTDGKPLYQKTIPVTASTSANYVDIQHGVSDIDKVVKSEGYIYYDDSPNLIERRFFPQLYYTAMENLATSIYMVTDTSIRVAYGSWLKGLDQSKVQIEVTIFYTKTTDTAGSGTWTTTGEYAHHYSTSEKVIGTWTDGKPLYEKTFNYTGTYSGGTTHTLAISLDNPDYVFVENFGCINLDGAYLTVPYVMSDAYKVAYYIPSTKDSIVMSVGSSNRLDEIYVTIRYTKTTD